MECMGKEGPGRQLCGCPSAACVNRRPDERSGPELVAMTAAPAPRRAAERSREERHRRRTSPPEVDHQGDAQTARGGPRRRAWGTTLGIEHAVKAIAAEDDVAVAARHGDR